MARDHVKVFYYRPEHQTIKICGAGEYRKLIDLFPDPITEHENGLYQQCVNAVTGRERRPYNSDAEVTSASIMPVLDIANMDYGFLLGNLLADLTLQQMGKTDIADIYGSPYLKWEPIFYNNAVYKPEDHLVWDRYVHP